MVIASAAILLAELSVGMGFHASDLTPLEPRQVKVLTPGRIAWVKDGKAVLPIVYHWHSERYWPSEYLRRSVVWLQSAVREMTGVEPELVRYDGKGKLPAGPALFIGDVLASDDLRTADAAKEEFRIATRDGSVYFVGKAMFAVYDFGERVLGIRQYWPTDEGGRSVVRTDSIVLPELDYTDRPVFANRQLWPRDFVGDVTDAWKCGEHAAVLHLSHAPYTWWKETNFNYAVTRPEIFELTRDGRRCMSPMLCYSNPRTLETYKERLDLELAGGSPSTFFHKSTQSVSVGQWDAAIDCQCETCRKLFDAKAGFSGNASPIIWGCFTRQLSDWLGKAHPGLKISISGYVNTCDCPEGVSFPAGNVWAEYNLMNGIAMMREPTIVEHEMKAIRAWHRATGNKVFIGDFLCWPAQFCSAPYVIGRIVQDHYRRLRDLSDGSFTIAENTRRDRLALSAYILQRVEWNPEVRLDALYDVFAARMFGAGAPQLREIVRLQEEGWLRPWPVAKVSNRNLYEISYPRKDVLRIAALFAEAERLTAADPVAQRRIAWYKKGFDDFFKESAEAANGSSLEPMRIQKVASDPVVDGKLDDPAWSAATGYPFVLEMNREHPAPDYPTEMKMVWTPNGVTFGFSCTEPLAGDAAYRAECHKKGSVEHLDVFLDVSGMGDGNYYQLNMSDTCELNTATEGLVWDQSRVRCATFFADGRWGAEIFIPFDSLKGFPRGQFPEGTTAAGKFWLGNFCRSRRWDAYYGKCTPRPGSHKEFSRRYTRFSVWNKDPSAFGKLQFVE